MTNKLPEGWVDCIFEDLLATNKYSMKRGPFGSALKKSFFVPKGYKVYEQKHAIQDDATLGQYFISQEKYKELEAFRIESGDFLVSCSGTIGRITQLPQNCEPGIINQALLKIQINPEVIGSKYFLYFFRSDLFQKKVLKETRGVAIKNIASVKDIKKLNLALPPLDQQKRIVAKIEELFSHIDAGIEALNKAKKLLKQYRQSVLKAAVTGELTKEWREQNKDKLEPASHLLERILQERQAEYSRKVSEWEVQLKKWKDSGENGKKPSKPQKLKSMPELTDDLESLPNGWGWLRLGDLAVDVFDGPFGSNLKSSDYVVDGVRVIRLENIGSLEFKDEKITYVTEEKYETLKKHTVSSGDIIFSSFVADGTRVVVLPENIDRAINKADCFCVRAFGDSIDANYLANYLSTTSTYKRLENKVHGATRPRINTTQLKELEIPIFSAAEQFEVVTLVSEKFDSIERLENEIDVQMVKADKNKQSILASAFSGKLSNEAQ